MYVDIFEATNKATIDIFLNMGFIDIIPSKKSLNQINSPLTTKLEIKMPIKSEMYITLPTSLVQKIGHNLFPQTFNPNDQEMIDDCAREFTNTLVGDIFRISTPNILFELGIPQICQLPKSGLEHFDQQTFTSADNDVILITHSLELLMSSKKDQIDEVEYNEVNINRFFEFTKVNCDIFVKLSENKFVKVINKDEHYDRHLTEKYLRRGVKSFFVKKDDFEEFSKLFTSTIDNIIKRADINEREKREAIEAAFDFVTQQTQRYGIPEQITAEIKQIINTTLSFAKKNKNLRAMLLNSMNGKDICKFSILVSYISAGIASKMEWHTEAITEKLGMAAIFHESLFHNFELSQINELSSPKMKDLDQAVKTLIRTHPIHTAEMLGNAKEIPADVNVIVANHHEKPDGSGFPRGLNSKNIPPLAAVFIMARDFACEIYGKDPDSIDVNEIITQFNVKYSKGNFRTALEVFTQMVKSEL